MPKRKTKSKIALQLQERLGGVWKAVRDGFGWRWISEDGREVRAFAQSTMNDWGDDWFTVYYDNEGRHVGSEGMIFYSEAKYVPKTT